VKSISSMTFDELLELKAKVEVAISAAAQKERKRLTESLKRLDTLDSTSARSLRPKTNGRGRKSLPPKYRNPENRAVTWAGRGHKPRWLVAALKGGKKKLSDFAIEGKARQR
jgi:DNA-binding protein H-NS